ncbi:Phenol regulator MopR [compost metagenome]
MQVIAATNKDLRQQVSLGLFRADLYYRLAVLPVEIPPLRQHIDDLPFLIDILLTRINSDREPSLRLSAGCRRRLMAYDFPGNIRELVNIFERLAVLADDEAEEHHLPAEMLGERPQASPQQQDEDLFPSDDNLEQNLKAQVQGFERQVILKAVRVCGSKRKAAQYLGIDIGTLIRKLQRD